MSDAMIKAINDAIRDVMTDALTDALTDTKIIELILGTSEKRYPGSVFMASNFPHRNSLAKFLSAKAYNCGGKINE